MHILITGAASRLGRAIAEDLAPDHRLRLLEDAPDNFAPEGDVEVVRGSLLDPDAVWKAVRGIHVVIHTGEPPPDLPEDDLERDQILLDLATRGTCMLLQAGIEAGVRRFLYGSTLEIFGAYPDDVCISEYWKPLPEPEMRQMARYLGELTCKEFARDHMVTVTVLRLGRLVLEEEVEGRAPDPMWLDLRDAAQAFRCLLNRQVGNQVRWARRYAVRHVCAAIPNPKFLTDEIAKHGYAPAHNFPDHWSAVDRKAAGGGAA